MKRILKILLPSILMLVLIYLMQDGKDILAGLFLLFPLMYILQGIICSDLKKELLISLALLSVAFLIPVNLLFHMGSCLDLAFIYNALSVVAYLIKRKIKSNRKGEGL